MIALLLSLALAEGTCDPSNHRCWAETLMAKQGDQASRVQSLYLAHRAYLNLFDAEREPEALCRAREALAQALALQPTPAHLVDRLRKSKEDAAKRERQAGGVKCNTKRRKSTQAQHVARARDAAGPVESPEPPPLLPAKAPSPAPVSSEPDPPVEVSARTETSERSEEPPPLLPIRRRPQPEAAQAPPPAVPPAAADRRQRARTGGGVVLLLGSAGFAGGMAAALVRRGELSRTLYAFEAMIDAEGRDATPAEYAHVHELNGDYRMLTLAAGVTGTASALGVIVGVALLAKQPRQVLALPWSGPRAAGLTLQGRF